LTSIKHFQYLFTAFGVMILLTWFLIVTKLIFIINSNMMI